MQKIISFVVACLMVAGASYAASEKSNQPVAKAPAASRAAAPAAQEAAVPDYRLERESCCGPQ